ncbi:NAD(P)-dependent dehydrogenase (short-subunit alcohol dehydrogenase family) [Nonomuraea fuscirosea]|uniref:NAD(P)-dependent dehydrogenase (Short-subunit alcohol dehydrogenase family) n=1 Tax=Nonomuraea fuscirosea TaxID=1291556 RepID=A0A2T0N2R5_9ACTN|nr:SDR family oxidoreductase [Nonomuraea fuscirosea]PRX66264.1 NAD(P)-dependent dehydrogenase (short-subunit alcohol dehydrogenase family) [Nonomuraea fuscirosea]
MTTTTLAPMPTGSPLPAALEDRTVMIIGGSSGIGLAAGELLASVGARVVLVGRDKARLETALDHVRATPGASALGIAADGNDESAVERALDQAGQVDHVLVTAGTIAAGALLDTPRERVSEVVDGRIWGAYGVARAAAPRLPAGGSITFTSGLYLMRPVPGASASIAGIGAVEGLTRALAVELAPRRLRVNAVRYGVVDTPLARTAMELADDAAVAAAGEGLLIGRLGTAQEAASASLFLMANNLMTGTVLTVDGGQGLV